MLLVLTATSQKLYWQIPHICGMWIMEGKKKSLTREELYLNSQIRGFKFKILWLLHGHTIGQGRRCQDSDAELWFCAKGYFFPHTWHCISWWEKKTGLVQFLHRKKSLNCTKTYSKWDHPTGYQNTHLFSHQPIFIEHLECQALSSTLEYRMSTEWKIGL